ncbi:MAG: response regulator transcription factor [Actinobacteria bacterium]|nr:response regulator transcription factor [Actinomycetota bacterium]
MSGCVVLVEDDPDQRRILRLYLEDEGYTVAEAADGPSAIAAIRAHRPVAVLLDVMLPLLSGRDVCRVIRAESDVPIIMVTARGIEGDVEAGLDEGADDYVVKPYRPRELMARVRAAVRRKDTAPADSAKILYADLTVDLDRRTVEQGAVDVTLTASEFDILAALLERPGHVLTRAQLISRVAAYRGVGLERTIDTHVRNIRRKLGDDAATPRYVATVVGVGYRSP